MWAGGGGGGGWVVVVAKRAVQYSDTELEELQEGMEVWICVCGGGGGGGCRPFKAVTLSWKNCSKGPVLHEGRR